MNRHVAPHGRSADRGFTLFEIMIGVAIMAIVTAISASTLILAHNATNRLDNTAVAIDSARLLSAELDRELRSATCIETPAENTSGNTLTFQTLSGTDLVVLTYSVALGAVTRSENLESPRTIITGVGTTTTAFTQLSTPLRTVFVNIPIRSANGGEFNLQTTVAGRNAWKPC
jgi:prepilin-type N-terminal cleavage/methylation domain-containing protein